jgi:hypothetical protein
LAACDPNNFKRFIQTNCFDPVALRVIARGKLAQLSAESARLRKPLKSEVNALSKPGATHTPSSKTDKAAPLPLKEGQPDKEIYARCPENSLQSSSLLECNCEHLRSSCSKERPLWEDDFEKPDFWARKAPAKLARVQLSCSLNMPCPAVLHIVCSAGLCLVDTCSDVSLARRGVLLSVQSVPIPIVIAHLGGENCLHEADCFTLDATRILRRLFGGSLLSLPMIYPPR